MWWSFLLCGFAACALCYCSLAFGRAPMTKAEAYRTLFEYQPTPMQRRKQMRIVKRSA